MSGIAPIVMWLAVGVWCCAVLGFFLTIVERMATMYFSAAWVFRAGPVVLRQMVALDLETLTGERGVVGDLAYRKLHGDAWGCHVRMWKFFFHTPFPLTATLRRDRDQTILVGRAPLGPTIFFGASMAFLLLLVLSVGLLGARHLQAVGLGSGGLLFTALLVLGSVRLERRRLLRVIDQLRQPEAS